MEWIESLTTIRIVFEAVLVGTKQMLRLKLPAYQILTSMFDRYAYIVRIIIFIIKKSKYYTD